MVRGIVERWSEDEGWGVLVSDDVPGAVWAHFTHIVGQEGFRALHAGRRVEFDFISTQQDGFSFKATSVRQLSD